MKKFKLVITPDVAEAKEETRATTSRANNADADYEDDGGLDDVEEEDDDETSSSSLASRVVFNFYLDENNQVPEELTQFSASDFDMLASSQGVKFELLVSSLPFKVTLITIFAFYFNKKLVLVSQKSFSFTLFCFFSTQILNFSKIFTILE